MINTRLYQIILELLDSLSPDQLAGLEDQVRSQRHASTGVSAIANHAHARDASRVCPHCGFQRAHRHGIDARGRQRFLCFVGRGGCGRTFNGLTGTPFARMRKPESWAPFIKALSMGHRSLDDLHRHGGFGVSRRTLWRWRTVVMGALSEPDPKLLAGVVEADETYFRESFKGSRGWKRGRPPAPRPPRKRGRAFTRGLSWEQIPVLTAVDRDGAKWEQVLGYRDDMPEALLCGLRSGSVLCTDDWPGFARAARQASAPHFVFPSRSSRKRKKDGPNALCEAVAGTLSLARVNALHAHLKSFVNHRARGVSPKYLQSYLDWTEAVRRPALSACEVILEPGSMRQIRQSIVARRE